MENSMGRIKEVGIPGCMPNLRKRSGFQGQGVVYAGLCKKKF